jgi:hypothetical protein
MGGENHASRLAALAAVGLGQKLPAVSFQQHRTRPLLDATTSKQQDK